MNRSLAQIFGYFIGDGNFEERSLRFRDARVGVLQTYSLLFKECFGIQGNITKMNNKECFTLNINSKEIRELFNMVLPDIFGYISKSENEVVKAFIKGFIDAEGHIDKKRAMISACQKKSKILRYLQLFLLRFGIRSTIKFGIGKEKINVLRISNRDILEYLQIGFSAEDKQKRLTECIKECKETYDKEMMPIKRKEVEELLRSIGIFPSKAVKSRPLSYIWVNRRELEVAFREMMGKRIEDRQIKQKINFISALLNPDIRFEKIREINIQKNEGNELFYDFSVPSAENYIANGFIVHNSTYRLYLRRGKKDSRVAKMIDSPNLPENETIFFLTTGGLKDEAA